MVKNKIAKNALWIIGVKIAQTLLTLFVTMFMARYLGPSNYGLINYAAAVTAFFSPIALLGLNEVMVQSIVDTPGSEGEVLGSAIAISIVSAIACIVGITSFSLIANMNEPETIIVCTLYSVLLIFQGMELIRYWFHAKYMAKYSSIIAFLAYLFASIYKIFLLITEKNIYWFSVSNAIEYMILGVLLIIVFKRISGQQLTFSIKVAKGLLKKSCYYILPNMMIVIFGQTDRIMLKEFLGSTATGLYSAAYTCAGIGGFALTAIVDSFRPSIFEGINESKNAFENRLKSLFCIIIYISLVKNLVLTIYAKPIVGLVFGENYLGAVSTLRWITWYITFSEIGVVRNIWVLAKGQQKWLFIINLSGAIINIVLNFILIPITGTVGAAIATVLTQFIINVVVSYIIKPIRPSTVLMLRSINPRLLIDSLKKMKQ